MTELALIWTDIQEVTGSAVAINILSHSVFSLWTGVLITTCDCFVFLFLENYGVRKLEAVFTVLIAMMALSFAWMFADTKPSGKELVIGLLVQKLGSKTIQQAVGVVDCVITPHNVFSHSALVQSRKIDPTKIGQVKEALRYFTIESSFALFVSVGLANAGQYLQEKYGGGLFPIFYIWGIGLLVAGQSSTIMGTYAGQYIMGGFLNLQLKKGLRSLISRSCAIVPTIIVTFVFRRSETALDALNKWINVLQSMQIPFALIPLFMVVSKQQIMGVFKIGPNLERVVWTVTAMVMMINGYVLLHFSLSVVNGLLYGFLAWTGIDAYLFHSVLPGLPPGLAYFNLRGTIMLRIKSTRAQSWFDLFSSEASIWREHISNFGTTYVQIRHGDCKNCIGWCLFLCRCRMKCLVLQYNVTGRCA